MFVEKELPTSDLPSVQRACESEVLPAILEKLADCFWIHFLVIDPMVPNGESCARGGTNDPVRVLLVNELSAELPIRALEKVPWRAVRLHGSDVKGVETFDIEIPARLKVVVKD